MRERGLKLSKKEYKNNKLPVAPHAGAWIEAMPTSDRAFFNYVAPHAGAWIEAVRKERQRKSS